MNLIEMKADTMRTNAETTKADTIDSIWIIIAEIESDAAAETDAVVEADVVVETNAVVETDAVVETNAVVMKKENEFFIFSSLMLRLFILSCI